MIDLIDVIHVVSARIACLVHCFKISFFLAQFSPPEKIASSFRRKHDLNRHHRSLHTPQKSFQCPYWYVSAMFTRPTKSQPHNEKKIAMIKNLTPPVQQHPPLRKSRRPPPSPNLQTTPQPRSNLHLPIPFITLLTNNQLHRLVTTPLRTHRHRSINTRRRRSSEPIGTSNHFTVR